VCEQGTKLGQGDAKDDPARPGRVDKRAEEADEHAVRERIADGCEGCEEQVVGGREEEVEIWVLGC